MVRTQSIISVSDEIGGVLQNSGSAPNVGQETRDGSIPSTRKTRIRGRRLMTKTLKNISGSSQEDTGGKDVLERIGLPREECVAKSCSPRRGNTSASSPGLRLVK